MQFLLPELGHIGQSTFYSKCWNYLVFGLSKFGDWLLYHLFSWIAHTHFGEIEVAGGV